MPPSPTTLAATAAALDLLLPCTEPADVVLSRYFRAHPQFGARERSFIAEHAFGVLRHRRLLEAVTPHPDGRALLLGYLVRFAGVSVRQLAPLLRRDESSWLATVKAMPLDTLPRAVQLDLPDWLFDALVAQMDETALTDLARALAEPAPLDLRVNTLKASRGEVLAQLARDGFAAEPTPYSPIGIRIQGRPAINRHSLFTSGKIEVQDEGSQLLGYLVAPTRHDMVVDFCAGAGGKTLMLGALMRSQGRLYAFDVAQKRLARLRPRLKRSGLSNVHPQLISGEHDARLERLAGKADGVLVDAPCSGLGTLRRNPDLKWRQTPQTIAELRIKQATILAAAARLLKPGGRLVYATCSLLREENEDIVDAFLATHADFARGDCTAVLARQGIALGGGPDLHLDPARHGTDGFYAAILERHGSSD